MKAMILAAGEGRRMRPLTQDTPKPLLEVGEYSLLEHQLLKLEEAGVREVIVNVSYLAEKILEAFPSRQYRSLKLYFSHEDTPLETAGGILNAAPLLGKDPFLLVNGDVWTDYNYGSLIDASLKSSLLAHLILVANPDHNAEGDFVLENGLVGDSGRGTRYTFSGISVIRPSLITQYENKRRRFALGEPLRAAMRLHKVSGELFFGEWRDIGTAERLQSLRTLYA
jgi:MurNAc alpha-1-phosphate uridylyltransferase